MSSTTSLINFNFGGIRRKDSVFSDEKITCSDCQNVELFFTGLNSGVGIRTVKGNISVTRYTDFQGHIRNAISSDEEVIGMFETVNAGKKYFFVYTESDQAGTLYNYNLLDNELITIVTGLSVTGKACGTDFAQGWTDMFVFSNGEDLKYIYYSDDEEKFVEEINTVEEPNKIRLIDTEGRKVSGLGLVVFDRRLWVFNGRVLWYSQQENCRDFSYQDVQLTTSAGFIEFVKPVTAIYPYLGSLAVFHRDSSCLLSVDATTGFKHEDESPGGCASYNSLIFHGTDLYFYDDTKKGVFSFKQIVNGDKTLGDNIAYDIQDELLNIDSSKLEDIRSLSVVLSDRNEVWFLIPMVGDYEYSLILIFDYVRGEWVKRRCQHINAIAIIDGTLYSGGHHIYEEFSGSDFDGELIESFYRCTTCNLGSDNTLKITKLPPRLTVDGARKNIFYVQYVRNYDQIKEPKIKEIKSKSTMDILYYDSGQRYDTGCIYLPKSSNSTVKMPSSTFRALEIMFSTADKDHNVDKEHEFSIKALEFSKIKVKQV